MRPTTSKRSAHQISLPDEVPALARLRLLFEPEAPAPLWANAVLLLVATVVVVAQGTVVDVLVDPALVEVVAELVVAALQDSGHLPVITANGVSRGDGGARYDNDISRHADTHPN